MSQETQVILKQLLFQILNSDSLEEAQSTIKFLCSKEDIAEAEKIIAQIRNNNN